MKKIFLVLLIIGTGATANALPFIEDSVKLKAISNINCEDANKKLQQMVEKKVSELGIRFLGGKIDKACHFWPKDHPFSKLEKDEYSQSITIRFIVDDILGHFHQP